MSISYVSSQPLKGNPYIPSVNIDLLSKVLTFKDQRFKQNAASIQQTLDSVGNTDLLKDEDTEYLKSKLNATMESINSMGGVDLGDISVSNNIHGLASDIYKDSDLLEAITSTKSVRSLQSAYNKMRTDPKLMDKFSTQNYAFDMRGVEEYMKSGRTTAGNGYKGTTSPTPFFDLDKAIVERAKNVKANYTESVTKDGIYIHKVTGEEVTEDQLKNEVMGFIQDNPQAYQQASINSWYLHRGTPSQDIFNEYKSKLELTKNSAKSQLDEYTKFYETIQDPSQKIEAAKNLERYKKYYNESSSSLNKLVNEGLPEFEKNIEQYKTNIYLDDISSHIASSMSYKKQKYDVKPDLGALGFMRNQISAADNGLEIKPDPTSPSGYSVIRGKDWDKIHSKKKSASEKGGGETEDPLANSTTISVSNTEEKKLHSDKDVAQKILDINGQKNTIMVGLLDDLIRSNPNLAKMYGNAQSQRLLVEKFSSLNDPDNFEIEDLKGASSKYMTPEQQKYIKNLYDSYEAIKKGETPKLKLSDSQVRALTTIKELSDEADLYQEMYLDKKGYKNLTARERALVEKYEVEKPNFNREEYKINDYGKSYGKESVTIEVVRLPNGNLVPTDGKDHIFSNAKLSKNGVPEEAFRKFFTNKEIFNSIPKNTFDSKKLLTGISIISDKELEYKNILKKKTGNEKKSYDVLDKTSGLGNLVFTQDDPNQVKDGKLNLLKVAVLREQEMGGKQVRLMSGDGEIQGKIALDEIDLEKSYISRIGTQTSDPSKKEVEIVLMSKPSKGKPSVEKYRVGRELDENELQSLGIPNVPRSEYVENMAIEYRGRTLPKTYFPSERGASKNLAVDIEIFHSKDPVTNEEKFIPQVKVPGVGYVSISELSGETVSVARQKVQMWIDRIYTSGAAKDTQTLFKRLKND